MEMADLKNVLNALNLPCVREGGEVGMSEFDKVDVCVNCKIRDFCAQYPDDQYTCEDVMVMAGLLKPEPPKEET